MLPDTRPGVLQGFQRRRCRAEQERHARLPCPYYRQIAGVVTEAILLFVSAVVFFINDDAAQVGKGCEHCRTCADQHLRLACAHRQPVVEACAIGQRGMGYGDLSGKPCCEPRRERLHQADFRHEQQHLPAVRAQALNPAQIDFGFARTGNAVKQGHGMPGQRQGGERRRLRLVQGWGGDGFCYHAAPAFVAGEPAAPLQIHQPGGRGSAGLAQCRFIRLAMLCEKCQRRRLFRAKASR